MLRIALFTLRHVACRNIYITFYLQKIYIRQMTEARVYVMKTILLTEKTTQNSPPGIQGYTIYSKWYIQFNICVIPPEENTGCLAK
jgi:hypothetical protein